VSDALRVDDIDLNGRYTYADYLTWECPERYELYNGEAFMMSSPTVIHQGIVRDLLIEFGTWLKGKTCQVFAAPLDVRLFPKDDNSDNTVVQPDLLVICNNKKISKRSINGAPELAIEVVSPSNTPSELLRKFNYYLDSGVKEFWVVYPTEKKVQVHILENGRYITSIYSDNDRIPVSVLPGLEIALGDLWEKTEGE